MIGYVTIKQQSVLYPDDQICIPSGLIRNKANGEVEAEFLCISKNCNEPKIWATRGELI